MALDLGETVLAGLDRWTLMSDDCVLITRHAKVALSAISLSEAAAHLMSNEGQGIVVTPNLSHLASLERSNVLAECYAEARLRLPDGWPVAALGAWVSRRHMGRVTGSDLVVRLSDQIGGGRRICVIGGSTPRSTQHFAARFENAGWSVLAEHAPRSMLDASGSRFDLIERIRDFRPDVTVIGVGSPKQELLAVELHGSDVPGWILCAGAGIDFLSGATKRSPALAQKLGLEWAHRALLEPRRLGARYARDLPVFLRVVSRNLTKRRRVASR